MSDQSPRRPTRRNRQPPSRFRNDDAATQQQQQQQQINDDAADQQRQQEIEEGDNTNDESMEIEEGNMEGQNTGVLAQLQAMLQQMQNSQTAILNRLAALEHNEVPAVQEGALPVQEPAIMQNPVPQINLEQNGAEEEPNPAAENIAGQQNNQVPNPAAENFVEHQQNNQATNYLPYGGRTLDLQDKLDLGLYQAGQAKFATLFDGKTEHLTTFQANVRQRLTKLRCHSVFNVNTSTGLKNILDQYGAITATEARQAAIQRWRTTGYLRQASYMLYTCIWESLSQDFSVQVLYRSEEFNFSCEGVEIIDGALLYKTICDQVLPPNRYTAHALATQLQTLRPKDFENNLIKFHHAFTLLYHQILAAPQGRSMVGESLALQHLASDNSNTCLLTDPFGLKNNGSHQLDAFTEPIISDLDFNSILTDSGNDTPTLRTLNETDKRPYFYAGTTALATCHSNIFGQ